MSRGAGSELQTRLKHATERVVKRGCKRGYLASRCRRLDHLVRSRLGGRPLGLPPGQTQLMTFRNALAHRSESIQKTDIPLIGSGRSLTCVGGRSLLVAPRPMWVVSSPHSVSIAKIRYTSFECRSYGEFHRGISHLPMTLCNGRALGGDMHCSDCMREEMGSRNASAKARGSWARGHGTIRSWPQ